MKVLVFTTVYPNSCQPNLGVFVRERMARVARLCDLRVVAPVPWFPFAGLIKEKYKARPPVVEIQDGVTVYHPRFFLIPGVCKWLDGFFLFLSSLWLVARLRREFAFELIDAHFSYPDGFAAVLLGKVFKVPVSITLRGTINRLIYFRARGPLLKWALCEADRVFSVCRYLADLALQNTPGLDEKKIRVIPNGVDLGKFQVLDKLDSRRFLGLPEGAPVLVSVGGLVDRKGHHRVLEVLPELLRQVPDLVYVIVGGGSVEGNNRDRLEGMIARAGLTERVRFSGEIPHSEVNRYLSAADIFVLPTQFEGWPNVFFEAMACGLPVVTTDVCGNGEIVRNGENGLLTPFGDRQALRDALSQAFSTDWDRAEIIRYAQSRPWEMVAKEVHHHLREMMNRPSSPNA